MWSGEKLTIPGNCQKLLAQMLYSKVVCKVNPRAECDWDTAGKLLDNHQELINFAVGKLAQFGWFTFRADFSVQGAVVDSGGFHEICWHVFWQNLRHWYNELPKDKYGEGYGFG